MNAVMNALAPLGVTASRHAGNARADLGGDTRGARLVKIHFAGPPAQFWYIDSSATMSWPRNPSASASA